MYKNGNMIKECLITTGATAKFPELLRAGLSEACLLKFAENGFTHLNFQCGDSLGYFASIKPDDTKGLNIQGFAFNNSGLNREMRACQAKENVSEHGLVICHAGSGTILDGMRLGLSLIVVPNTSLLDNHQEELAAELERQGYVTRSDVNNLANAIELACKKQYKLWGGQSSSFSAIVDDVVGYEDDVRARLD